MLSDESSSDSETGRFKGQSNVPDEKKSNARENTSKSSRYNRNSDEKFDRRSNRDRFDRFPMERNRHSRYSPVRNRHSRERSRGRRSHERHRQRDSREQLKRRGRSGSRERKRKSRSSSYKSPITKNVRNEIKTSTVKEKKSDRYSENIRKEESLSPTVVKRSVVQKPVQEEIKKCLSPVAVHDDIVSDEEIQPGSYYSMVPTVVKEKSEESSEIDSSDDEKLRAKLLNLEKELHKNKKKKHKKKHKKKTAKSNKEKGDTSATIEVSSTTDIPEVKIECEPQSEEVSSTQKNNQRESSEEGEIVSDNSTDIDPNDLRHKLKRSKGQDESQPKLDVCGPALPPHLQSRFRKSNSPDVKSTLSPYNNEAKNIGPTIPDNMRKVLAEKSPEKIVSECSDDDGIGPLPVGAEEKWSDAHQKLEERAYEMKIKNLDGQTLQGNDVKSREQWMLELPEGKTKFLGLEARSFRAKAGPDMSDRSSWTDTPEEKARKAAGVVKEEDLAETLSREAKERHISSRDKEQEEAVKKHKKKHKRDESLLELHQKKLKKKKKKESEEKKERKPFSRETDLQVNRFDEAQKKSIIKKAQGLNTRFSAGEAKYL